MNENVEKKIYGQIYAIVDPFCEQLDGKVQYIGKHKLGKKEVDLQLSLEKYLNRKIRGAKSEKSKESKRPHDIYLRNEIRDCLGNFYEKPKIEQVEICYSEKELNQREEYWRAFFKEFNPNLLNRAPGGSGGCDTSWIKGLTKETDERVAKLAEKISKIRKELNFIPWNKNLTKKTDDRVKSPWNKGLSSDSKSSNYDKKIALAAIKVSENHADVSGANNPMFGRKPQDFMTDEAIIEMKQRQRASAKISQNRPEVKEAKSKALKGKKREPFSDEWKQHMSNWQKGKPKQKTKLFWAQKFIENLKCQVIDWT
jgi:hypothetical protein